MSILLAQNSTPVFWSFSVRESNDTSFVLHIKATIEKGWYIYSEDVTDGGPIPLIINFDETTNLIAGGTLTAKTASVELYDDIFEMNIRYYEDSAIFERQFIPSGNRVDLLFYSEAQACFKKDGQCRLESNDILIQAKKEDNIWIIENTKIIIK